MSAAPDPTLLTDAETEFGPATVSQFLLDNAYVSFDEAFECCDRRVELLWAHIEESQREWEWAHSGGRGA